MMFCKGFVLTVLKNGNVVPEKQNRDGKPPYVVLPEGTEYGIRLRNKNDRQAVGEVYIDGEHQGSWIIPSRSYIDIFRPDFKDAAFKLVSPESSEATDFGKNQLTKESGVIEVKFYLEKKPQKYYPPKTAKIVKEPQYPKWPVQPWQPFWYGGSYISLFPVQSETVPTFNSSESAVKVDNSITLASVGVTVEGNQTGQQFTSAYLDVEETYTTVKLRLFIEENKQPTLFCGECGFKRENIKYKYCGNCGSKYAS